MNVKMFPTSTLMTTRMMNMLEEEPGVRDGVPDLVNDLVPVAVREKMETEKEECVPVDPCHDGFPENEETKIFGCHDDCHDDEDKKKIWRMTTSFTMREMVNHPTQT